MHQGTTMQSNPSETTHLIQTQEPAGWLTKPVALLLLMKLFDSAFKYQLVTFNIDAYTGDPNSTESCAPVPHKPQGNAYSGSTAILFSSASIFFLPTLGGLISDRYFGCIKVLTCGCIVQFWVSALHTLLIQLGVLCFNHWWFFFLQGGLSIALGLVDPLLVYALMRNAHDPHSRRLLVFAYFIATAGSESLGSLPSVLRYLLRHLPSHESFEFLGILFTMTLVICTFIISKDEIACEKLRNENFEFPRFFRLRRFYIIAAGFIPFTAVIVLSRNMFSWKEIKYYTTDDDGFISSVIPIASYNLAIVGFCLVGAVATAKRRFPQCLTIGVRIRIGVLLMLTGKVVLFIISFMHTGMSELGQSNPFAVQTIYFAAAFTDGVANALTGAGMYEMVDCIADRCAKAMYMGIFYTTWGLCLMLTGIVSILLRRLPFEGEEMLPKSGVQPQFYIRYAIVIFLLLLCYAYFTMVALPLAESLIATRIEEETADPHGEYEAGVGGQSQDAGGTTVQ